MIKYTSHLERKPFPYNNMSYQYLEEFTLKRVGLATSMLELTQVRIDLLRRYLEPEWGDIEDFFGDEDWSSSEIRFMEWEWQDKILIDIHGWPGDTEDGAIFIDKDIVFINGDQTLNVTENCPLELKERVRDLEHLRMFQCQENHPHCRVKEQQYEKLMPGGNFSLYRVSSDSIKEWLWTSNYYTHSLTEVEDGENYKVFLKDKVIIINGEPTDDVPGDFLKYLDTYKHIRKLSCKNLRHKFCLELQEKHYQLTSNK